MRFNIGASLGPIRASQPISLGGRNNSRPGYMARSERNPAPTRATVSDLWVKLAVAGAMIVGLLTIMVLLGALSLAAQS